MTGLVDTLMNLLVFVFVGLLIWLYFKKAPSDEKDRKGDCAGGDESSS